MAYFFMSNTVMAYQRFRHMGCCQNTPQRMLLFQVSRRTDTGKHRCIHITQKESHILLLHGKTRRQLHCCRGFTRSRTSPDCQHLPYERTQAEELLQCLRKIAPYIIVDCGSCIANDILSAIALMEADAVLRLVNCDLKSISYLSSQLPLLKDSQWDAEKQYKVASNVYPNEASEHIERVLGNVAFQIPHSEEVKAQVLEGNLLKELVLKDSKGVRKTMEAITKEVFGC